MVKLQIKRCKIDVPRYKDGCELAPRVSIDPRECDSNQATFSFYADLFNFSLIFLPKNHLLIARPGNENLVALQPTVSGNFETLTVWKFSGKALRH